MTSSDAPDRAGARTLIWHLCRRGVLYLTFILVVAVLAEILLEGGRTGWRWGYLPGLAAREPGVAALNTLVIALLVSLVLAVTGHLFLTATLVTSLATVLGVASHLKFVARHEPLYPRDLVFVLQPEFLYDMVEPRLLWLVGLGLVGLAVLSWGLSRLFRHVMGHPLPLSPRGRLLSEILVRATSVAVLLVLLSSLLDFNHQGNTWRRGYEHAGAHWKNVSQVQNYRLNGFVAGFLRGLDTPAMTRPAGYSRAAMEQIVAKYTDLAEERYAGRDQAALDDVNVVLVLSESFSDPTELDGITLAEDPLPRTRELMEGLPHGRMLAHKVGGGTSSAEFEALTGMSLSQFGPTLDVPYQQLVPRYSSFPSAVELFNQLGHRTVAIHPFVGSLYSRDRVYPILGFSRFVQREGISHPKFLEDNGYISDESAYAETLEVIERSDQPVFVNLITMQNHAPYDDKYTDPIQVSGVTKEAADALGAYARGINYTDVSTRRLIDSLSRSDEKTVLLFYGDHRPASPEEVFRANSPRRMRETPFFVYSNFRTLPPEQLPTTSPIQFMPKVFDAAGAPLPPYYTLLDELGRHTPAMNKGLMIGSDDQETSPGDLSPHARQVLQDYRMVQYDLSVGERYAEGMFYPSPTEGLEASGTRK